MSELEAYIREIPFPFEEKTMIHDRDLDLPDNAILEPNEPDLEERTVTALESIARSLVELNRKTMDYPKVEAERRADAHRRTLQDRLDD